MNGFRATPLSFELQAMTRLAFGQHKGPALRGALFQSLRDNLDVCLHKSLPTCQPCALREVCPLAGLLATVDDGSLRGRDVPRPMTIQPPSDGQRFYQPGDRIHFGVTLFGDGARFAPYLVLAARELERSGLGLQPGTPRRGAVRLGAVEAVHPFTDERQVVRAAGDNMIRPATLAVTNDDVRSFADRLPRNTVSLDLFTPLRLIEAGRLVKPLRFDALFRRLVERLGSLAAHYGEGMDDAAVLSLIERARTVETTFDSTRWVEVESHSSRTGRWNPLGGYIGTITFRGELGPFLPWLVWGMLTHVGKSATRGNGLYRIRSAGGDA